MRWAQLLLNQHGANPPLQPNSVFGPETHAAVISFQRSQGLRADGVIGKDTWANLVVTLLPQQGFARRTASLRPVAADSSTHSEIASVADWPLTLRFERVLQRVPSYLAPELAMQFRAMLTPANIGILVGTFAAWAVSHAFGAGEIIDLILLGIGAAFVGMAAFKAGEDLGACLKITLHAKDTADLEKAADSLAQAVVILGITAFFALLAKVTARFARAGGAGERGAAGSGAAEEARAAAASARGDGFAKPVEQKAPPSPVSSANEASTPGAAQSTKGKYPDFNPQGGTTNCGACSDAVDTHLAGQGTNPAAPGPRGWPTRATTWDFNATPNSIENALQTSGDGARGIVYVTDGQNAHVFNATNQGGQIIAIDGQSSMQGSITDVAASAGYSGPGISWGWSPTFP